MKAKHYKGCSPLPSLAYQNYLFPTPRLKICMRQIPGSRFRGQSGALSLLCWFLSKGAAPMPREDALPGSSMRDVFDVFQRAHHKGWEGVLYTYAAMKSPCIARPLDGTFADSADSGL